MTPIKREVRRFCDGDGRLLFYAVYLGSRRAGWKCFQPGEVPDFDGASAVFEVAVKKGTWVFGRRAEGEADWYPGATVETQARPTTESTCCGLCDHGHNERAPVERLVN